LTPR
ncbi:vgrG protein, partial [Vibrio cholerae HC-67A1]